MHTRPVLKRRELIVEVGAEACRPAAAAAAVVLVLLSRALLLLTHQ